jgi:hypothetical protein
MVIIEHKFATFVKRSSMKTIQIDEKSKIGKNVLEMLKVLAKNDNSIKFLDETDYLLSTEANKEALMQGIDQVKKGEKGKTIKPSALWK